MSVFLICKEDYRELLKNIFSNKDVEYYGTDVSEFPEHRYAEFKDNTYIEDTTGVVPKGLLIPACKLSDLVSF